MPDYITPPEHRLDLHFSRSRFNREFEDTLLLIAGRIAELGVVSKQDFKKELADFLTPYLGNLTDKAIANTITEPARLFGLVIYRDDAAIVGRRTLTLARTQDVPRFFKSVVNKFQFPNGVNKPHITEELVRAGVRFKPGQYLIKLLRAGKQKTGKTFVVTPREVARLVFNDTRVTVDGEAPEQRLELFLKLRADGILCDKTNDEIRTAREFMQWMVWANLLVEYKRGRFFLNEQEKDALDFIESDTDFFEEFDLAKQGNIVEVAEIKEAVTAWMEYYADADFNEEQVLKTSLASFSRSTVEITTENNQTETVTTGLDFSDDVLDIVAGQKGIGKNKKEIGDEGEAIVYSLEKERVKNARPDLLGLVRIVSNDTSLGFDIQSVLDTAAGTKKYIEVKTTKRNFMPDDFKATAFFTISYNEWLTAKQYQDSYFIARVIIAKEKLSIFIIENPFKRFEENKIQIFPVGYRLIYEETAGTFIVKDQVHVG